MDSSVPSKAGRRMVACLRLGSTPMAAVKPAVPISGIRITRSGLLMAKYAAVCAPFELPDRKNWSRHSASTKSLTNADQDMKPRVGQYSSRVSLSPKPGRSGA